MTYPNSFEEELKREYFLGVGYALRWPLYEFADDGLTDFHRHAVEKLELSGDESILDIGCGQAGFLRRIKRAGHTGLLAGLDCSDLDFVNSYEKEIGFVQADASVESYGTKSRSLPIKSNYFDVVTALFMLYHVKSPEATIRDMSRITRAGGKIAIATSGERNKIKQRETEVQIAEKLGMQPVRRYQSSFTAEVAEEMLGELFHNVEVAIDQNTTITIEAECLLEETSAARNKLNTYIQSLKSVKLHYEQVGSPRFSVAMEEILFPKISAEIEESGFFQDEIHRKLFICSNPVNQN